MIRRLRIKELEFTLRPEELHDSINRLQRFLTGVAQLKKAQMQKQQQGAMAAQQQAQQQQGQGPTTIDLSPPIPELPVAVANESQPTGKGQASDNSGKAGANATATGKASGHGVPKYGDSNFQVDKLAIQRKKREPDDKSTPATPAMPSQPSPVSAGKAQVKPEPAKVEAQPAPRVVHPFKCPVPTCVIHTQGFPSQAEADAHAAEAHDFRGDALEWCLANMRKGLGLDDNGKTIMKEKTDTTATAAKSSAKPSKPLPAAMKAEGQTPCATPMSRTGTQTGVKTEANTNANLLKPTPAGFKPGSPESSGTAMKRTHSALTGQTATPAPTSGPSKPTAAAITAQEKEKEKDPWSTSLINRNAITHAYTSLPGFTLTIPKTKNLYPPSLAPSPEPGAEAEAETQPPGLIHTDTPTPESAGAKSPGHPLSAAQRAANKLKVEEAFTAAGYTTEEWLRDDMPSFDERFGANAGLDGSFGGYADLGEWLWEKQWKGRGGEGRKEEAMKDALERFKNGDRDVDMGGA